MGTVGGGSRAFSGAAACGGTGKMERPTDMQEYNKKLENEFFSTANLLKFYPYRFPVCYINLNNSISYRKIVINKKYIILYYINQNNVFVDLFLDTRKYYNFLKSL